MNVLVDRKACPFERCVGARVARQCHVCALGVPRRLRGYATCPYYATRLALQRADLAAADALDNSIERMQQ